MIRLSSKKRYQTKLAYNRDYNKRTYKSISIRLNQIKDIDVIKKLMTQESIKDYICMLVRRDLNEIK